jgi:drug/metabolite transporter (DMT)-like permease
MLKRSPATWAVVGAFAIVYLVWGSTYLAILFAIETMPPLLMAAARFLVAGSLLYGWTRLRGTPAPSGIHWRSAVLLGGLMLCGGNGGVVWAEQRLASGLAALLVSTVPLWVVMLESLGLGGAPRRRPSLPVVLGVVGGLLGVGLLVSPGNLLGGGVDLLGALVVVVASLSWATGSVYTRRAVLPSSLIQATAMEMIGGGALLLVLGMLRGEAAQVSVAAFSAKSLLALAYLVVFGSLIAFTAYVWLLKVVDTAKVATYAYVNPVVALALGWAFAGEGLTARAMLAAVVILVSVGLIITFKRRVPAAEGGALETSDQGADQVPGTLDDLLDKVPGTLSDETLGLVEEVRS